MPLRLLAASLALLLASPLSHALAQSEKAVIDVPHIQEASKMQTDIDAQADKNAPADTPWFVVLKGSAPIIITAPHATKPFRDGSYRFADGAGTAALARQLNTLGCATVIYTRYQSPSDPNYYDDNAFKQEIAKLIKEQKPTLLLDLHGSSPLRPYDVDFGTMNGASLLGNTDIIPTLSDALRKEGLLNLSDNYFPAAKNQTITKYASGLGVPTVQLEINGTWLAPALDNASAHRYAQLLQALTRYVRTQTNNPGGSCQPVAAS